MAGKSNFWDSFDKMFKDMGKMMSQLPEEIESRHTKNGLFKTVNKSTSISVQDGHVVKVTTVNGKTKTTVDGEEVVPKKYADALLEQIELFIDAGKYDGVKNTRAYEKYKKYREKR